MAALVGRPNVGKSTFLNRILGYHLVAVSDKPQTTRRHWRGIYSDDCTQVIFVDTPGAHEGKTRLNRFMLGEVDRGLADADVILCLCDPSRVPGEEDELIARRVAAAGKPVFLLLNKSDITTPGQRDMARDFYTPCLGSPAYVGEISGEAGTGLEALLEALRQILPTGPFFYPPDQVTDAFERDIGAELIREAALGLLREEVPHCLAVEIDEWKEQPDELLVRATLYVERESQKAIVVGKGGAMIKALREQGQKLLRQELAQKVKLNLFVKTSPDWRNHSRFLADLGLAPPKS